MITHYLNPRLIGSRVLSAILIGFACLTVLWPAAAGTIPKNNSTDLLNLTTSWIGGVVPGTGDIALWNTNVTAANTVGLGGDLSWGGVAIGNFTATNLSNPGGNVVITNTGNTLTLGTGGLDLSLSSRSLTLSNAVQLNGNQTWSTYSQAVTFTTNVTGSGNILKLGNGAVTLNGANTFTGNLTMGGGALNLNFASPLAPATNIIPSSLTITSRYNGGVLTSTGLSGSTNSQALNGVQLTGGALGINVALGGASNNFLSFGAISRTTGGGSVNFGTGGGVITTTSANDATGILGPWATRGGTAVNSGTDWATVSGGTIAAYSGYTTLSGVTPAIANNASSNVRVSSASTGNPIVSGGTVTVNSLLVADPAARTIDIQAGNTLRLGTVGGILRSNGGPALTIGTVAGTGSLSAGGAANTPGELILNVHGGNAFTVNSAIVDNGGGAVTLTLEGGNTATFPGTNVYTHSGGTYVNNGSVSINGLGTTFFGNGPIYVRGPGFKAQAQGSSGAIGGCLWLNNSTSPGVTITNDIFMEGFGPGNNGCLRLAQFGSINGTVTLTDDALITAGNSNPNTINGRITGPGGLWLNGGNTKVLTVTANNNDYQGDTYIAGQVLRFTQTGGMPATTAVVIGQSLGTAPATVGAWLDVRADQTFAGLADGLMLTTGTRAVLNGNGGFAFNQGSPVAVTLTLSNNTRNLSFSGSIFDNGSAAISLVKDGSYTQTFAGSNYISGTVRIAKGVLALGHTNALQNTTLNLDAADAGTLNVGALPALNLGALEGSRNLALSGASLSLGKNDYLYHGYSGVLSGSGNLVKTGNAVQTFDNNNSYAGTLTINGSAGGSLALGASGAFPNITQVTLVSNATFDVSATASGWVVGANRTLAGSGTVNGNVTVSSGGTLSPGNSTGTLAVSGGLTLTGGETNVFDLSPDPLSLTGNDLIDASLAALNVNGVVYIKLNPYLTTLGTGEYPLIKYGSLGSGNASNFVVQPIAGYALWVTNDTSVYPNMIALVVTSLHTPISITWRGNGTSHVWDNANAANLVWRNGALAPVPFYNGDTVTFDDTGSNTPPLSLTGALAPATIEVNATKNYTFGGTGKLSGGTSVANSGTGTLTLATDNDYLGSTTISAGKVQVGNGSATGAIGSGPVVNNGALVVNRTGSLTIPGDMSGSGSLAVTGAQVTLAGVNSYSGDTTISGGGAVISPTDDSALGYGVNLTLNNGTLATANAFSMTRNVILGNGGGTISNLANSTLGSAVTGAGSFTKSGDGRLIVNNSANTYAGNTIVSQGTLQIDAAGSVPTNIVLNGGGIVFNVGGSYVQPGVISGLSAASPAAGSIGVSAAATDVLLHVADGSNIFNVPFTNSCPLLVLTGSPNAQVYLNGYSTPGFTLGATAPDGAFRNNSASYTLVIAGGVWNNSGANLGQNNTTARMYGTTIISNATFIAGGARYMMGIQYLEAGGSLLRTNANTPAAATGTPNAARWNYETTPAGANCGVYVRPGGLLDNWSGNNAGNNGSVYDLSGVAANQTFFLEITGGTFLSGVHGDGANRSMNVGWAEPTGTSYVNLFDGKMLIGGGIFSQAGSANSFNWTGGLLGALSFDATGLPGLALTNGGGTLAPGDTNVFGRTTITGNYLVQPSAAALDIDLGGTSPATVFSTNAGNFYDNVIVTGGRVVLNGSLVVREINGFEPTVALSSSFTILTATNISGTFTNLSGGRVTVAGYPSRSFRVTVTSTNVVLDNYQTPTLQPYFYGTPLSGLVPLSVTFTDVSNGTGITNRLWNFGDGATTNTTGTNVVHTYTLPGTNNVSLTLSTAAGGSTLTRSNYVVVTAPLVPPSIGNVTLAGSNLVLSGTGGTPGASYRILGSTNVALTPLALWTPVATNLFAPDGGFTNSLPVNPTVANDFYILVTP